ncbi:hypothetical protein KCU79_g22650, partial [Aureobasidium melanogenum]
MSFFGKLKGSATPASPTAGTLPPKKDATIPQSTPLEKHIADLGGPVRPDGSDKFFGFENVLREHMVRAYLKHLKIFVTDPMRNSYANSIIQCLYYSTTFREN